MRAALVPEEDIVDIMLERILATNDATSFIHYANFFGVIFIALATKKDIREGRIKKYVYGMISSKNDFDRAKILCQCANLEVVIAYLEIKNFSPEQILELMDVTIENFDVEVKEYNSIITALTKKYYILTGQSAPEKYLKL